MISKYQRAVVFGVFDGLHPGHQFFLSQAFGACNQLIVALALDQTVLSLKQHLPKFNFEQRKQAIVDFNPKIIVAAGDEVQGTWTVLKQYKPDIVFIGHDQQALAAELKKIGQIFEELPAHYPEQFKSSLLNNY